jgi:hypothetical protein
MDVVGHEAVRKNFDVEQRRALQKVTEDAANASSIAKGFRSIRGAKCEEIPLIADVQRWIETGTSRAHT